MKTNVTYRKPTRVCCSGCGDMTDVAETAVVCPECYSKARSPSIEELGKQLETAVDCCSKLTDVQGVLKAENERLKERFAHELCKNDMYCKWNDEHKRKLEKLVYLANCLRHQNTSCSIEAQGFNDVECAEISAEDSIAHQILDIIQDKEISASREKGTPLSDALIETGCL